MTLCLIDRFLKPRANAELIVTTARSHTVTELSTDSKCMLRYDDRSVETPVSTTTLTTDTNGEVPFELDTQQPGDFVLLVTNVQGQRLARLPYHVAGDDLRPVLAGDVPDASLRLVIDKDTLDVLLVTNVQGQRLARLPYHVAGDDLRPVLAGDVPDASLRLVIDKDTLEANDTATLQLTSPFDGMALVTLETDRVLTSQWLKVKRGDNTAHLTVPEDVSGRAWIYASPFDGMALVTLETDRVLTSQWLKVKRGDNTAHLTVPEDVSGRAWIYASLIRSSTESHRYLKAYARTAQPVMLNLKKRALNVTLDAPQSVSD